MNLTHDAIQELKRHFVGGPSEPSRFWLARADGPQVGCAGEGVSEATGGFSLHFGPVPALGEQSRIVFAENLGQDPLRLALRNPNPWLRVCWRGRAHEVRLTGGEKAALEVVFRGEEPEARAYAGSVLLTGEGETGEATVVELGVRLTTFLEGPFGRFSFGGFEEPRAHDFGQIDPVPARRAAEPGEAAAGAGAAEECPPYTVAITSVGSEPLRVAFEDLPAWLSADVDGYRREGPAQGTFFERQAPVRIEFRPVRDAERLGARTGRITLRSNDSRPAFRLLPLTLSVRLERERPYVTAAEVFPVTVARPHRRSMEIQLANCGNIPARLDLARKSFTLAVGALPEIPGAGEREPGRAVVKAEIAVEDLAVGTHALDLALHVRDGDPAEIWIKVPVTVVEVESAPDLLDFGAVRAGERRERSMSFRTGDGRPLHLEVRVLPEVRDLISAEVASDGTLRAVCHLPAGSAPASFDAAGIEVTETRLGFRRHVRVRWKPAAGWLGRLLRPATPAVLSALVWAALGVPHAY
jgi:hypothetical protein